MKKLISLFIIVLFSALNCNSQDIIEIERIKPHKIKKFQAEEFPDIFVQEISLKQEEAIRDILENEPSITEIQREALKFAAIPSATEFKSFRAQAKLRNFLPSFSSGVDLRKQNYRAYDSGLNYDLVQPNLGASFSQTSGNLTYNNSEHRSSFNNARNGYHNYGWGADLKIYLPGVVYDDEITDILSEQRRFATIRNDYMEQIFNIYQERRQKQILNIINPPKNKVDQMLSELEIQNLTDKLDSLTGGWFSRVLKRKKHKVALRTL